MGCVMVMGVSVWLLSIPRNAKQSVYGAACLAGSGTSIMLVTALTMTADLIGDNQVIVANFSLKYISGDNEFHLHIKMSI